MSYNDDDIEAFTIISKSEIAFYLNQLINDQEPLTVMFDEGRESLLTMALHLDDARAQLILDWGGSDSVNQKLLRAASTTVVANPQGVRNLFHTGALRSTTYQGRPAFSCAVPAKYIRLQRRDCFRLTLPISQRLTCKVSLPTAAGEKPFTLSVVDICVSGVGLEVKGVVEPELGQILATVSIDLGKLGVIRPDLEVRFVGPITRGSETMTRIGCRFAKLGRGEDILVQRLITQIQRDQRARLG